MTVLVSYCVPRLTLGFFASAFALACSEESPLMLDGSVSDLPEDDAAVSSRDAGANEDAGAGARGEWRSLEPMPRGPRQETAVVALGTEIFVIGGLDPFWTELDTVEAYDVQTETWRTVTSLPVSMHHANAAVVDSRIYVLGFLRGTNFAADGRVFSLDPANDSAWTEEVSMPSGTERGAAGVAVVGTRVHLVGGYRGGAKQEHSVYETQDQTWSVGKALPRTSEHLVAATLDGLVFAVGGRNPTLQARVDSFDPVQDGWTEGPGMTHGRAGFAGAAVVDGRVFVFGGEGNVADETGVFADVEVLDPSEGWGALAPMPRPKHGTGAAAIDGKIYIPGGAKAQGLRETTAELDVFIPPL